MSYINVNLLKSRNLSLLDLQILQLAKQARIEDVSDVLSEYSENVNTLLNLGYLESIKGKKGDNEFQKIRTTKLGTEALDLISTPLITDVDIQMYNYLCTMYLEEDSTRTIGNRKAGLRYCAEYRQIMGFTPHEMYWLCNMFVNNVVYTKVLEYIFFEKKNNPYGKFKDNLDSSKLHQFWLDNEFEIREFWSEKIKTE
jgi:hypothetical protein